MIMLPSSAPSVSIFEATTTWPSPARAAGPAGRAVRISTAVAPDQQLKRGDNVVFAWRPALACYSAAIWGRRSSGDHRADDQLLSVGVAAPASVKSFSHFDDAGAGA